jgi:hypothetical protein
MRKSGRVFGGFFGGSRVQPRDNVVTPRSRKSATRAIAIQADNRDNGVIASVDSKAEILMEYRSQEE